MAFDEETWSALYEPFRRNFPPEMASELEGKIRQAYQNVVDTYTLAPRPVEGKGAEKSPPQPPPVRNGTRQ